jgi:serine protease Do
MSDKEWYNAENWYTPLKKEEPKKEAKHNKTMWRTIGAIALVLLLIIGTSVAFANNNGIYQSYIGNQNSSSDVDYDDSVSGVVFTSIPRAGTVDFTLNLEEPGETELSLQELYKNCASSIVAIKSYMSDESGYNWGTGIIASEDGLIITNAHIVESSSSAEVTLYNDESYEAKLVGADSSNDVALLKIEATGLPAASFGNSNSLSVGDSVVAIGNPVGEEFRSTMTSGIISAIDRGVNYTGSTMNLIQTDTAINSGSSGGALFNLYGQVVGITSMKIMSRYSSVEGIGFAIPSSTVKSVVDDLARGRASIGITVIAVADMEDSEDWPDGLYVYGVQELSDAAAKGIEVGDILIAVNGTPVTTTQDVADIKEDMAIGDTIVLTIWRDGKTMDIEVELMNTYDVY